MNQARFVTFEGLDGSGKTTLMKSLVQELQRLKVKMVVTREPGGTDLAEAIRSLILQHSADPPVAEAEVLLYAASRAQHVANVIRPALRSGQWVLCDRYSESTVAFQCYGRGLPREKVDFINRFAEQATRPDLVVLIDLPVLISRQRQRTRQSGGVEGHSQGQPQSDRIESEKDEFHEKVRAGFLAQAISEPERFFVLDGELSAAELQNLLIAELNRRGWLEPSE